METEQVSYQQEVCRKLIHLISLSIPIIYSLITKELAIMIIVPVTVIAVAVDISRHYSQNTNKVFLGIFGRILRSHELNKKALTGSSTLLIGSTISIVIFPQIIAITAITILVVSDTAAALIGRKWGKRHFMGKTLEGSLAFICSAIMVVLIINYIAAAPDRFILAGIIAAFAGGVAEAISVRIRIDDNFTIPLTVGMVLWGLTVA